MVRPSAGGLILSVSPARRRTVHFTRRMETT
jgi:hypothetical protein